MGQFEFEAAREAFDALAAEHPDWFEAKFNLAIATLNRQDAGDEQAARALLQALREERPDDLRVLYTLGLLALRNAAPAEAEALLRAVTRADASDAYAFYFLGQALLTQGRAADALSAFERAIEIDPLLRSARYAAAQTLARLGRAREAEQRMAEFERDRRNPLARLAEFKYTRMGPKSEAIDAHQPVAAEPPPAGPLFAEPVLLASGARPVGPSVPSAADIDGDGETDLFLPGGRGAPARVLYRRGERFELQPDHALAGVSGVEFAAWGDIDNDGRTDALLCGSDRPPVLLKQTAAAQWTPLPIAAIAKLRGARDCSVFDVDHDGDLDLFILAARGQRVLLSNNTDGTFRSLSDRLPAPETPAAAVQTLAGDLDNNRSLDLAVLHAQPPHEVIDNALLWNWGRAPGLESFTRAPALAAALADLDADGRLDLLAVAPDLSVRRWRRGADGAWSSAQIVPPSGSPRRHRRAQLAAADLDGDGRAEVVLSSGDGVSVWQGQEPHQRVLAIADDTITAWTLAALDDRGPSLVTLHRDGAARLRAPGPGRAAFVRVAPSGREDPASSIRSNASGIGARLAARVDGRWVAGQTLGQWSGPGQNLAPVAIGLGGAPRIDYLRIDWPDGSFQTEVAIAPGGARVIAEVQRQLASCPVLFAWDGSRFAFVSDLLGVGGLGYLVAPGEYAPPRPWENFLLPAGLLQPRDGRYVLKVAEPMEEAAYLDALRLVAYDLPPGWDMALDERMQIGPPQVTGRPFFFRRLAGVERAINDRGQDVTAALRSADLRAADPGALDSRFIGRLAREHVLTLEFDRDLDAGPGQPLLVVDGWIEYPYSQTMFAAWQAQAAYRAPTLEARGSDGRWRVLLEEFGYPAGMPRIMAVPLPSLPAGTRALRLRTNQEIYWDRVAVAWSAPAEVRAHRLPLAAAEVRAPGFARRTTGPQRQPWYDYARRAPLRDTWAQSGHYTALGRADELVAKRDDALAIIGPGEEVHVEFLAALPPLPAGWSRRFVLEANGWAKDMDLYTRHRDTLAPLPAAGHGAGPRQRKIPQYNIRTIADP